MADKRPAAALSDSGCFAAVPMLQSVAVAAVVAGRARPCGVHRGTTPAVKSGKHQGDVLLLRCDWATAQTLMSVRTC